MAKRFVNIDRATPILLPQDMRDWLPQDHIARFILEAVDSSDLSLASVNRNGSGDCQYPPGMMLSMLIDAYCTGRFSSRSIEEATFSDVALRFITADTHPDHDTICTFRRNNGALISSLFLSVLVLAKELKFLRVGTVSIDGSKIEANASKHKAVSFGRAQEKIDHLQAEVTQFLERAETADSTPLADGLSIPKEIQRREDRIAQLLKAREAIRARAAAKVEAELEAYEAELRKRKAEAEAGEIRGGPFPPMPSDEPKPGDQYNFTDPESRLMKQGGAEHFEQSYNAQAAVDAGGSLLVIGAHVSNACNDKEQLVPTLASIAPEVGRPEAILIDNGFYSEKAVQEAESRGVKVYASVGKQTHQRSVVDLEADQEPEPLLEGATTKEAMAHRMKTAEGKAVYKLRKETVEPVFGIIKEAMGLRRFLLRGLAKVNLEWALVTLAYNVKRLFSLIGRQYA